MKEALKQSKNKSNKKRKMREGDGTGTKTQRSPYSLPLPAPYSITHSHACLSRSRTVALWLCPDPPSKRSQHSHSPPTVHLYECCAFTDSSMALMCCDDHVYTEPASKAPDVSEAVAAALTSATAALSVDKDGVSSVASDLVPPMPSSLRRRLVLDWERLTRRQQILRLPTRLSVVMLLTAFVRDHKASSGHEKTAEMDEAKHELVLQVCEGLLCYFERCLSSILLYRIERPQMQQLVHQHNLKAPEPGQSDPPLFNIQHMTRTLPNPPPTAHPAVSSTSSSSSSSSAPSSAPTSVLVHWLGDASTAAASPTAVVPQWSGVYGVEHLVRMLCKLPAILRGGEVEWETEQRQAVRYTLLALYRWLSAHDELIYSYSSYEPATVEYMSKLQQPQHNGVQNSDSAKPSTDQEKQQQQHSNGQKKLDLPRAHSPSKAKRKR